jgi:hypothetical protein
MKGQLTELYQTNGLVVRHCHEVGSDRGGELQVDLPESY